MRHMAFALPIPGFDPGRWGPALAHRLAIAQPEIIDRDGQPVGDTIVSIGSKVSDILIAGADLSPSFGSALGTFIAGTREPGLAPLLSHMDRLLLPAALRDELVEFPTTYREIKSHLLDVTGLFGAEAPFVTLAGYSLDDIARLLDNLRARGGEGAITIAAIMARFAAINARDHHENVKRDPDHSEHHDLAVRFAPVLVAVRAILGCIAVLEAQFRVPEAKNSLADFCFVARARVWKALLFLEGADIANTDGVEKRVGQAITLVTQLSERLDKFCFDLVLPDKAIDKLARHAVAGKSRGEYPTNWSSEKLDEKILSLGGVLLDAADDVPVALRLSSAADRLNWFLRFDTSGLFKLIILRRFDDLLLRFPWMSGRISWFSHLPLGLLGALAQLHELGRACQIAREIVWRSHGNAPDAGPVRLGLGEAHKGIANANQVREAIRSGTRLGTALSDGAVSHAILLRLMEGDFLAPEHSLSQIRFGRWQPDMVRALDDDRTLRATQRAEAGKFVHGLKANHDDHYVRYYGRTLLEVLFGALFTIFDSGRNRRDILIARENEWGSGAGSIQKDDGERLPAHCLKVGKVLIASVDPSGIELAKFERDLRAGDRTGKDPATVGAQSVRRHLCQLKSKVHRSDAAGAIILHWKTGSNADDRSLRMLLKVGPEAGAAPIADLFLPVLWFCREIDLPIWSWVQGGANLASVPGGNAWNRDRIAAHVRHAHDWAPSLYARALPTPLTARITSILMLGATWLSLDHKFSELQ